MCIVHLYIHVSSDTLWRNIIILPRIHGFLDMLLELEPFKLVLKVTHKAIRWAVWLESPQADINLLLNHPKVDGLMYWTFRFFGLQAITFIRMQCNYRAERVVCLNKWLISYGASKEFNLFILHPLFADKQADSMGWDGWRKEWNVGACITCWFHQNHMLLGDR